MPQTHILLIEDDEVDRESVERLIGGRYQLHVASMGSEGLTFAQSRRPDCVLVDYRLPDMDGYQLASALLQMKLPTIILTVEETPEIIVSLMKEGVHDFLLKRELTSAGLVRAIQNAIDKSYLQEQLALHTATLEAQNTQIRILASALTLAEQRERRRIAQLLHDHVQQLLHGIHMRIHLLVKDLPDDSSPAVTTTATYLIDLIEEAISTTRTLAVEISPPTHKDDTLATAIRWLAAHMEQLHNLHVDVVVEKDFRIVTEDLHVLVTQLVRELLFNVVKHANVLQASVFLRIDDDNFCIIVEDEGVGFDKNGITTPKWQPEKGYGLYSIGERLSLFGGRLDIDSVPGDGARVTIVLSQSLGAVL